MVVCGWWRPGCRAGLPGDEWWGGCAYRRVDGWWVHWRATRQLLECLGPSYILAVVGQGRCAALHTLLVCSPAWRDAKATPGAWGGAAVQLHYCLTLCLLQAAAREAEELFNSMQVEAEQLEGENEYLLARCVGGGWGDGGGGVPGGQVCVCVCAGAAGVGRKGPTGGENEYLVARCVFWCGEVGVRRRATLGESEYPVMRLHSLPR